MDEHNMFLGKEYVYEVYKEKSFSKAAKNLYISQPSLSATIKRIENKIGFPIFDRSISPIGLTECGKEYISAIEAILDKEHNFENYVAELKNLQIGTLSIGGSNLFTSYVLPPLIADFKKRYPMIQINLVEDSTEHLESLLLSGELDFIIDNSSLTDELFDRFNYLSEHLLIAVPMEYSVNSELKEYQIPFRQIQTGEYLDNTSHTVPLEYFKEYPFILLKPNNDTQKRGLKLCKAHGFNPNVIFQLDQQATAYNIACSGMGICFVSDTLIQRSYPHPNVIYYKLEEEISTRQIYFYSKRNKYLTFTMKAFLKLLQ